MRDYKFKTNLVGNNIDGSNTITAGEFNSVASELKNVLVSAGLLFSDQDSSGEDLILTQLATATNIISQKSLFWNDASISANNVVLSRSDSIILPSSLYPGMIVKWVNALQNTGSTTIKVGSYFSVNLLTSNGANLGLEDLKSNALYSAVFDGTAFRVEQLVNISLTGMIYASSQPLPNSLLCNGSAVSRSTYNKLFQFIGTTFGVGDGVATFNLPNLVNRVPRGAGSLISVGAQQEDAIRNIFGVAPQIGITGNGYQPFDAGTIPSNSPFYLVDASNRGEIGVIANKVSSSSSTGRQIGFDASRSVPTATENRVKSLGVNFYIYY